MARLNNILLAGAAPIATPGCSHFDRILGQKLRGGALAIREATPGPIVTFTTNIAKELASLIVNITPVQSGSGDPSPTNIRPISGWEGCTISRSGADTSDPTTISISWQSEAGTVYGGYLKLLTGELTGTHLCIKGSDAQWYGTATAHVFISDDIPNIKYVATNQRKSLICENYKTTPNIVLSVDMRNNEITQNNSGGKLMIRDNRYTATKPDVFIADVANVKFVYELATPITYQLTPTQIATLLGVNNIWADTGDIAECKYYYKK